jgi:Secretion system C-terminal sorting domain
MNLHDRCAWIAAVLATLLSASTPAFAADSSPGAPNNTEPVWKNGELAPPLPDDPLARAAALNEVRRRAASSAAAPPSVRTVTYRPSEAVQVRSFTATPQPDTKPASNDANAALWFAELRSRLRFPDSPSEPVANAPTGAPAAAPDALGTSLGVPSILETFDGIDDTGISPPSPDIAVGPKHIMITTASRFAVMDKCGTTLLNTSFQAFFNLPATRNYYLPRVIYDEWENRWIMVFVGTEFNLSSSALYVAHSLTPDPAGAWGYFYLPPPGFPGLKDFPGVSVTPDAVYFTWDRYNLSTFVFEGAVIGETSRTNFYGGMAAISQYFAMTNPNDGSLVLAIRPAQMQTYAGIAYFVDTDWAGDDFITLWKLTGAPGASVLTGSDVVVPAYVPPPDVAQPGGTLIDSGDCRIQDAVYSSGQVYTVHGESGLGRPIVRTTRTDVITLDSRQHGLYPAAGYAYAYGAIDVDDNDQFWVALCTWGSLRFPSVDFFVGSIGEIVTEIYGPTTLVNGQDSFTQGGQPYRWGFYTGCARDPIDDRTMWIYGPYGSDVPANSWTTRVGAVTAFDPGNLVVSYTSSNYSGGFEGGPFSPDVFTFDLENTGQTAVNWTLTDVPYWLTTADTEGRIAPGDAQSLSLELAPIVNALPADTYGQVLSFNNCTGPGTTTKSVFLVVGHDGSCPGAELPLYPKEVPPSLSDNASEPGMYVTAIEDAVVCAVDITAYLGELPQAVFARIYEANGTTRGALVAEEFYLLVRPGNVKHSIPIAVELKACNDYEVSVGFTGEATYDTYNELSLGLPNDVGGVLRLRNASESGNAAFGEAALIQLVTTPSVCENSAIMDLGGSKGVLPTTPSDFGMYVQPYRTGRLCTVGLNVGGTTGSKVTARVYAASGLGRDYLIAEGSAVISQPFLNYVDVPISALLVAGYQYDIAVEVDKLAYYEVNGTGSTPYLVNDTFNILEGEVAGGGPDYVPTLSLGWTDDDQGVPFTLSKPGGPYPPALVVGPPVANGVYVTSLINQEMYSLGVYADVPFGEFVGADVYNATGTTRGSSLAHASVMSDGGGLRWHDVPVSVSLGAGGEYDFAISIPTGSTRAWLDTSGLPFNASGIIQIRNGESGGNAGNDKLIYLRMNACDDLATPVVDHPVRVPMFLAPPMPNPSSGLVTFGYAVDEEGPAEITIYDVAGRRVVEVFATEHARNGASESTFDASKLPSGVYFVQLKTRTKNVARKFVVTH